MLRENNIKLEDESELRKKANKFAESIIISKEDIINILVIFNDTLDEEKYSEEQLEEFINNKLKYYVEK